jgi:hypothetical protein
MATVGSTAGGYVKGVENTMFSKWNKGLIDPWKEKYIPPQATSNVSGSEDDPATQYATEFWNGYYSPFGYTVNDNGVCLNDEIIDKNVSLVTEFYKYVQAKAYEKDSKYSSPTNGFVPISLGVTLDGLSGIKIYNAVNVDTRFLPRNYPENLKFIIKGVNHKLSNSDWETNFETIVISQNEYETDKTYPFLKETVDEILQNKINPITEWASDITSISLTGERKFNRIEKAKSITEKLMSDLKLKDFQAAAIVGSLIAESGLYPDRIQGSGVKLGKLKINGTTGYGYAQWTYKGRQENLATYASSKGVNYQTQNLTDDINYEFLIKEIKGEYPGYFTGFLKNLQKTTNVDNATNLVTYKYENPAIKNVSERKAYALQILQALYTI